MKIPNTMLRSSQCQLRMLGFAPLRCCSGINGLSYVEVMVSMLTSALFLSTTLQGYVAATGIKAKSQQMNQAIASIQADVETIRHLAQVMDNDECTRQPSGGYVQKVMSTVMNNDTNSPQNQSPQATIGSFVEDESTLKQSSTISIKGLDDYKMRRVLSLDKREGPSGQVLQISYQIIRLSASSESDLTKQPRTQEDANQPPLTTTQTETRIAQLHTSILPKAALVC
jgi:hypothetical protein